jgi:hypothetical protein
MGWNKQLEIPAGGKGDLRAAVRVSKKGKASLILGLSDRVAAQLNGAKRANIWLGDGDEAQRASRHGVHARARRDGRSAAADRHAAVDLVGVA